MNHNAYRNTHLAYLGAHNGGISRVVMSVREQLRLVEVLILNRYLLFLIPESLFQGLLLNHLRIDSDTPDFFGVMLG